LRARISSCTEAWRNTADMCCLACAPARFTLPSLAH